MPLLDFLIQADSAWFPTSLGIACGDNSENASEGADEIASAIY